MSETESESDAPPPAKKPRLELGMRSSPASSVRVRRPVNRYDPSAGQVKRAAKPVEVIDIEDIVAKMNVAGQQVIFGEDFQCGALGLVVMTVIEDEVQGPIKLIKNLASVI